MKPLVKFCGSKRAQRGAAAVEAMLLLPLIVWATFAIIQWGSVINAMNTITDLGRSAARFAAVHATESTCNDTSAGTGSVQAFLKAQCASSPINYSDLVGTDGVAGSGAIVGSVASNGTFTPAASGTTFVPGTSVAIKLQYPMAKKVYASKLVPGISAYAGAGVVWPKVTVMVVEKKISN
jgi:Flp pilus assembly protein TadG